MPWSDVQAFLAVIEHDGVGPAARKLSLSEATVRSRIARIEHCANQSLFTRTSAGVRPTRLGRTAADALGPASDAIASFTQFLSANAARDPGEVRLSCTEGLGTYWVTPRLPRKHDGDGVVFSLQCTMNMPSFAEDDIDVAVHLDELEEEDVTSKIIGYMCLRAYASERYIETYGLPPRNGDLSGHFVVLQTGPQMAEPPDGGPFAAANLVGHTVLLVANSSAHFEAIRTGVGIGALPTYAEAVDPTLVRTDLPLDVRRPIYLSTRRSRANEVAIKAATRCLRGLFEVAYFR